MQQKRIETFLAIPGQPHLIRVYQSDFSWDRNVGRFRNNRTGRFVAEQTIRNQVDTIIAKEERRLRGLTVKFAIEEVSFSDWQLEIMQSIKSSHIASYVAGKGGYTHMTQSDWGIVGSIIKEDYKIIRSISEQIDTGGIDPKTGRLQDSIRRLSRKSRSSYYKGRQSWAKTNGFLFEESVLGVADHCMECVDMANKGRVPIGTLIPVGERICRSNCRCKILFFKTL